MIRWIVAAIAAACFALHAQAAGLYPLSRMQQFDTNGKPLSGARLFLFDGGTSTPRVGYKDSSLTSPHPNPIVADSAGRLPLIYLDDGFYRHRLTTKTGTTIFDDDGLPVLSTTSGGSGTSVDPDSVFKTRDVKIRFDNSPIAGYVRLNGKTIGSALSGATERANADTQSLYEELWAFANVSVTGGKGANAAADFAANKPLVLPNMQGQSLFGMPDMGGTANTAFAAFLSGTTADPGATGGANTFTIGQTNLPNVSFVGSALSVVASGTTGTESVAHTHDFSGTTGTESNGHTHSEIGGGGAQQVSAGTGANVAGFNTGPTGGVSNSHQHNFSGTTAAQNVSHTHNVTVNGTTATQSVSSGGSGTAVNKLPPLLTFMIFIRL